jgi:hypothetical protein
MAVGGMITPSTYQVPTNIATQPSYFQNYAQSTAPFQPFQPQTPTPNAPFQGLNNVVGQNTTGPSFDSLMPQLTGKRETKEYRNAAGQKLFIPFISGKPIYPIPEGYTLYVAEAVKDTTPAPTSQSTSVRQEGGESSDPLSGTTSVRGLDGNSVVSTDFSGKSAADISKSMGNMSVNDRTSSVMNAMQEAKGYTGFAKGMQQFGIGQPNANNLNSITAAFGYDPATATMFSAANPANLTEALSQAAYGKSLDTMSTQLGGVMPSFTLGYKPGDVDPSHGGTYTSYGSSTGPGGHPSFSSITDAINNAKAMGISKTSYTHSTALTTINDPKSTPKAKELARKHLNALNQVYGKQQDEKDKSAVTGRTDPTMNTKAGRFSSMKSGYGIGESTGVGSQGIGSETDDTSKGGTAPGTAQGTTETTGGPTTSGGLGGGTGVGTGTGAGSQGPSGSQTSGVSEDVGDSGNSSAGDNDGEESGAYKGSLITKRKASGKLKKKYMKRGGLASRK